MASVDPSELQSWLEAEAETLRAELARLAEERSGDAREPSSSNPPSPPQESEGGRAVDASSTFGGGERAVADEVRSLLRELERQTRLGEEGVKLLSSLQEQLQGSVLRFES